MLKKNSVFIFIFLALTSCCRSRCCYWEAIKAPCRWQIPIECGTSENPSCFLWWEALFDPALTSLIKKASIRNAESFDVAKSYIQLRGLQMRSNALQAAIEAQNELLTINKELSNRGFFSLIEENEDQKSLDSLIVQKLSIEFSIRKLIFHLSTLVGGSRFLNQTLCQSQNLPELFGLLPLGQPKDFIYRSPTVQGAKKQYLAHRSKQTLFNYQKEVLSALESAESARSAFAFAQEKIYHIENVKRLKVESYRITKDLYNKGLKDDQDLLTTYQELLLEEDALIQSKVELLKSYVDIYEALGVPWRACCK